MKLTSLSLLISSALLSQSALAGTTNLVELGEQAKAQLNHMRQLATDATNVVAVSYTHLTLPTTTSV